MTQAGIEWSKDSWRTHVPNADDAFVGILGERSLPELARATARAFPDRTAVDIDGERISHGQLDGDATALGDRLAEQITPGDRVLLCGKPTLNYVRWYLGTLRTGGVVVPANPAYTADELAHLVEDSGATLAVADVEQAEKLTGLPGLRVETIRPPDTQRSPTSRRPSKDRRVAADDTALLAYTSGTTGKPKGVPLSHRRLVVSIRSAMAAWRWSQSDVLVHALPLFHQHGLSGLHATLIAGSTARVLSTFRPETLLDAARDASVLFAVPTMYERLLDTPGVGEVLERLRLCVCGSAPLSEDLADRLARTVGMPPLVRYGTTESGLDVSNPYGAQRGDTVGVPLPGVLVRLVEGEIQLRGPQVFEGYWRDPAATEAAFTPDGWFRTGDIGALDQNSGHLMIKGRTKELIITGGMNVYPGEVEAALERHPDIAEAAVAGLAHTHWGEQVTAWVVPASGATIDPETLIGHAKAVLAPYKCPKQVYSVPRLPRNHMGKIARSELDTPCGVALRRASGVSGLGAFVELCPEARFEPGTPVAIKDNIDIAGQRADNGLTTRDQRADADARALANVRAHGYIPIGRTTMPELAWSLVTPSCRNPWDPTCTAGGSSGGSAVAVATGVVPAALGTDTGGSIRVPAALCGVAGLRPTLGAVLTAGVAPLAPSLDTVGAIAGSAAECLRMHEYLSGAPSTPPPAVRGLRIGWPTSLWADKAHADIYRLIDTAAEELQAAGARIVELELPLSRRHARTAGYTIMLAESFRLWGEHTGLSKATADVLRLGSSVSNADYENARALAREVRAELDAAFTEVSALLLPTVVATAGPLNADSVAVGATREPVASAYYRLTALASVAGLPALSVPAGLSADGLPVGAQLIGPAGQEALVCMLGSVIEAGAESQALQQARTERNANR